MKRGKEALPTNNLFALIVLLFIFTSALSGYLSYDRSRNIVQELTGEIAAEARICVNKQPSISQNCSTTGAIGVGYYCDVDATDPDNDSIVFYDNTGLFNIDPTTGEILFTPAAGDAGTHIIQITASDERNCSNSNVITNFTLTIPGIPVTPPAGGGGGGGGGAPPKECTPDWECTPWTACRLGGLRERICYTLNNCLVDRPIERESCIYVLPPVSRRPGVPEYYLCNFDVVDECYASFGMDENWIYTYKGQNSTINILAIDPDLAEVIIDRAIDFFAKLKRINPVDVTYDEVADFEYIPHRVQDRRVEMTVRLVEKLEVVIEKPIYIQTLPWWLAAIIIFVYNNACIILLLVLILAAVMIYANVVSKLEERKKEKR